MSGRLLRTPEEIFQAGWDDGADDAPLTQEEIERLVALHAPVLAFDGGGVLMKTTQYLRQEKAIASADAGSIRQRWLWGLRLLRDSDAFAPGSSQLKPGRVDELTAAYKAKGVKLSATEIRLRLACARAYETDAQIQQVSVEFESWFSIVKAGFPTFDRNPDDPDADHRTDAERRHDHARALLDRIGEQGALFPLSDFEPVTTTVKELREYAEDMLQMAGSFHEHAKERLAYVDDLSAAVGGDESVTWQDAQDRLEETGSA